MDTRSPSSPAAGRGRLPKSPDHDLPSSAAVVSTPSPRRQLDAMASHDSPSRSSKALSSARPVAKKSSADRTPGRASKESLRSKARPNSPKVQKSASRLSLEKAKTNSSVEVVKELRGEIESLKSDFGALRALVTCKICDRFLYEPYTIACGHTYCYGCLCQWFINNKEKKTCPDCRAFVTICPAPAYLIREMTQLFVQRASVLPANESLEQHAEWQKEEADLVSQDRNNEDPNTGGLFKGVFNRLQAIRDEGDGVERCPICVWELEDGQCPSCGRQFDEDGIADWRFSDVDDSEADMMAEDMPWDMDADHLGLYWGDGASEYEDENYVPDHLRNTLGDDHAFAVSRWLAEEGHRFRGARQRIPAAHSAAGGRGRSYTASILSDRLTEDTEMGVLQEEDEGDAEDEDSSMVDEDSSMSGFIVDDERNSHGRLRRAPPSTSTTTTGSTSTAGQVRRRPAAYSETSSAASQIQEEEDDDEDDAGPIAHGRRRRNDSRNEPGSQRRRPVVLSENSTDEASEEENRALLDEPGWAPLDHEGPDEEGVEERYDSEGGDTTVGWGPITHSNDRIRTGGSLTPTADRPFPPLLPQSRAGNPRVLDASRGLRRRSSAISTASATHYEDGEADDDDSDVDRTSREVNQETRDPQLRNRISRIRMNATTPVQSVATPATFGTGRRDAIDDEDDDLSDTTQGPSRARQSFRGREYDPDIDLMLRRHNNRSRQIPDALGGLDQLAQLRAVTPISRPRTANRNRVNQGGAVTPLSPGSNNNYPSFPPPTPGVMRLRTPVNAPGGRMGPSTPNRGDAVIWNSTHHQNNLSENGNLFSPETGSDVSPARHQNIPGMVSGMPGRALTFPPSNNGISSPGLPPFPMDIIDRPASRVSSRPPSAAGRRAPGQYTPTFHQVYTMQNLNFAARQFQAQLELSSRNPFNRQTMRSRTSNQRLRGPPSNLNLRTNEQRGILPPQSSFAPIPDAPGRNPNVRSQGSRRNMRADPNQHRLNNQSSTRTLRAGEAMSSPQASLQSSPSTGHATSPPSATSRRTSSSADAPTQPPETMGRGQPASNNNPFAPANRGQSTMSRRSAASAARPPASRGSSSRGDVSDISEPMSSASAASTSSTAAPWPASSSNASPPSYAILGGAATQPGMSRRRSYRNIAGPPSVFMPYANAMPNILPRARNPAQANQAYDMRSSINMHRGPSQMVAASEQSR